MICCLICASSLCIMLQTLLTNEDVSSLVQTALHPHRPLLLLLCGSTVFMTCRFISTDFKLQPSQPVSSHPCQYQLIKLLYLHPRFAWFLLRLLHMLCAHWRLGPNIPLRWEINVDVFPHGEKKEYNSVLGTEQWSKYLCIKPHLY